MVVWWPDLPHKLHRKQAGALKKCAEAAALVKLATKAFRASRGPWSTSKFGRARQEARGRMIKAMDDFPDSHLLQINLAGMARDLGMNSADLSTEAALRVLKENKGLREGVPSPFFRCLDLAAQASFTGLVGTS